MIDDIQDNMCKYYMYSSKVQDQFSVQNTEWNKFRIYNIQYLLKRYMYPFVQLIVKNELHEQAERWVIQQSAYKFHDLLNVQPYTLSNNSTRIMSVV